MQSIFAVHKLNDAGMQKAHHIAKAFEELLFELSQYCVTSTREFSIVTTKLEEASFFAKKSMASLLENQLSQ